MRKYDYSDLVSLTENEKEIIDSNGLPLMIPRRYEAEVEFPDLLKDFDWQITYKFSSNVRQTFFGMLSKNGNPIHYGERGMTFRRLYSLLCAFNGGVSFIDDYLQNVLPYTSVGVELQDYLLSIKQNAEQEWTILNLNSPHLKKSGRPYKRSMPKFTQLKAVTNETVQEAGRYLAVRIKEDLVNALRDGRVPLTQNLVASSTAQKRQRAGLNGQPRFYASAQFINNITIFCRLEKKGKWLTDTWV